MTRSSIPWIIIWLVVIAFVVVFVVVSPVHSQPRQSSNASKTAIQIDYHPYVKRGITHMALAPAIPH
jgi:hypothetical protein